MLGCVIGFLGRFSASVSRFSAKHVGALVARPAPGGAGPSGSRLACPNPCLLHWRQGPRPNRCLGPGMWSERVRSALRARGAAWLAAVSPGVSFATGRAGSGAGASRPDLRAPADPRATPARTRAATVHARTWRAAAWRAAACLARSAAVEHVARSRGRASAPAALRAAAVYSRRRRSRRFRVFWVLPGHVHAGGRWRARARTAPSAAVAWREFTGLPDRASGTSAANPRGPRYGVGREKKQLR